MLETCTGAEVFVISTISIALSQYDVIYA